MNLTYADVQLICAHTDCFKLKHQVVDNTPVAQCTYFLASADDFFPTIIEIQDNGEKMMLYGELVFNGKKLKDMDDDEIKNIGTNILSQFKFQSL